MSIPTTGYKQTGNTKWYGSGYCGICGSTSVIARACRWWDPDDGWKYGVLCGHCTADAESRPPRPKDYAFADSYGEDVVVNKADEIDVLSELLDGDEDGVLATIE
jgi:hypothetical protein